MRISAKADYALRAAAALASADGAPVKAAVLVSTQHIPRGFVGEVLVHLRTAGIVASRRGGRGGYWLARPASEITVADILRAVDGPLATIGGHRPEWLSYGGPSQVQQVWIALRANMRAVTEHVTLADLANGRLPPQVATLASDPGAWR